MSYGEDYFRSLHQHGGLRHAPAWIANYPPQKPVTDALEAFGIAAPCQVIANACASGTNAIGHAFECVRSGRYERVLSGGYDALSELVFVGFDSLQASTPEKCRPFDRDRTGMVLGEGAAVLALEDLRSASRAEQHFRGNNRLRRFHRQSSSDAAGSVRHRPARSDAARSGKRQDRRAGSRLTTSMRTARPRRSTTPPKAKAINDLFTARVPVSSTKGMMGHSLGAAGAIEAVFCILSLQHQFLPANINFADSR